MNLDNNDSPNAVTLKNIFKDCKLAVGNDDGMSPAGYFPKLYGKLSSDIHGYSWSGLSVKVNSAGLSKLDVCVIKSSTDKSLGIDCDEVCEE